MQALDQIPGLKAKEVTVAKWEYMQVHFKMNENMAISAGESARPIADELLNDFGRDGWEVVSVSPEPHPKGLTIFVAFMKRKVSK